MQHFTHKLWLKSETNVKFTGKKMGEEEGEEERKELGRKETLSRGQYQLLGWNVTLLLINCLFLQTVPFFSTLTCGVICEPQKSLHRHSCLGLQCKQREWLLSLTKFSGWQFATFFRLRKRGKPNTFTEVLPLSKNMTLTCIERLNLLSRLLMKYNFLCYVQFGIGAKMIAL